MSERHPSTRSCFILAKPFMHICSIVYCTHDYFLSSRCFRRNRFVLRTSTAVPGKPTKETKDGEDSNDHHAKGKSVFFINRRGSQSMVQGNIRERRNKSSTAVMRRHHHGNEKWKDQALQSHHYRRRPFRHHHGQVKQGSREGRVQRIIWWMWGSFSLDVLGSQAKNVIIIYIICFWKIVLRF